jgi:hypothetical protein
MNSKKNNETTGIPIFFVNFVNRKLATAGYEHITIL